LYGRHQQAVPVDLPRFDAGETEGGTSIRRGVPVTTVAGHLVTTVFDLIMAQYAVGRDGLPGEWPAGYDDPAPYTPAWQEQITSVPAAPDDRHLLLLPAFRPVALRSVRACRDGQPARPRSL
jgi:nitrate reductase alpha subunit